LSCRDFCNCVKFDAIDKRGAKLKTTKKLGKIQVQVEGFNQTRLINILLTQKVDFFDVDRKSASLMILWLSVRDSKKAFAIFDKMCYNCTILTQELTRGLREWGLKRLGALVGAVIFTVVMVLSNSFVWRVRITGLENVAYNTVENILQANNIKTGILSSSIDKPKIKQQLLQLDNVVDVSLSMRGTTLVVTIFFFFL
jgi:hypothetical protein